MQPRTPFLFAMPPLFAWMLAITTSFALVLAVNLVFVEPSVENGSSAEVPAEGETSAEASEEAPAPRQVLSSTGRTALIILLVVSVGFIPFMARRKRKKTIWWSAAAVATGFLYLLAGGLPLIHPLILLLALVFIRPSLPAVPAVVSDLRLPGTQTAAPMDAPSEQEEPPTPPTRRRPPRRRRRPRS
ncbi:MAG: hypothetical protein OXE02_00530 [Chloroflexi bacterium]|nr:hypothetical protein [Chloroflexota bacterium]